MSDVIAGIRWASGGEIPGVPLNKTPADVINLSLSSDVIDNLCPAVYQEVIDEARARGAVVVVSAGNQGKVVLSRTPANCRGVLSVGATDDDGSPTSYTNAGRTIGMMAQGGEVGEGQRHLVNRRRRNTQGPRPIDVRAVGRDVDGRPGCLRGRGAGPVVGQLHERPGRPGAESVGAEAAQARGLLHLHLRGPDDGRRAQRLRSGGSSTSRRSRRRWEVLSSRVSRRSAARCRSRRADGTDTRTR